MITVAGSDHWPVCLSWEGAMDQLPKSFCFKQFWLEHKDFKGLVEQWWQEMADLGGTRMYSFQHKLKVLKAKIRTWNKTDFGNIFEEKKRLVLELTAIQQKGMEFGWDLYLKEKEKDLESQQEVRER